MAPHPLKGIRLPQEANSRPSGLYKCWSGLQHISITSSFLASPSWASCLGLPNRSGSLSQIFFLKPNILCSQLQRTSQKSSNSGMFFYKYMSTRWHLITLETEKYPTGKYCRAFQKIKKRMALNIMAAYSLQFSQAILCVLHSKVTSGDAYNWQW